MGIGELMAKTYVWRRNRLLYQICPINCERVGMTQLVSSNTYPQPGYHNRFISSLRRAMIRLAGIFISGALLCVISGVHAQPGPGQVFEWGFTGAQASSPSLPSCKALPVTADSLIANGVPPFYMIAFAVGGAPTTAFIGTNKSDLKWTVDHSVGTRLLLGVTDSKGTSGGIGELLYEVTNGSTSDCIPPAPSPTEQEFTISANVTDTLNTCQPWDLTIHGGTPPYNLTLTVLNASDVTNVTLGANYSVYTYINRAEPDSQMIASASDVTGRWATGSPFVRTQGSPDVNCMGLTSSSSSAAPAGNTTQPVPSNAPHAATSQPGISRRTKIIIIAVATVAFLPLVGSVTVWAVQRRRRRRRAANGGMVPFLVYDGTSASIPARAPKALREAVNAPTAPLVTMVEPSPPQGPSLPSRRGSPPPYLSPRPRTLTPIDLP
ncbi:hypothetical protein C8R44DRAFT_973745 [Mycena epipterygia]|nr:hypothetical protein C8R44DRAFT_973745 [Mycena epipterygia]